MNPGKVDLSLKCLQSLAGDCIFQALPLKLPQTWPRSSDSLFWVFFFLQAIKALLPVQEKLGLLLAKMGNTGKQNVCLDLHAAGETSSIKPEAAMLCQAVLSWCSYGLGVKSIVINYAGNSKLLHTLLCSNSASEHREKLDYVLLTLLLYLLWLLLYWLCTMVEVS